MGFGATLLSLTNGIARGKIQADQIKRQRQLEDLRTLAELAQIPGFSLGDSGTPTSPTPAPPATPGAGATDPLPPILRGSRTPPTPTPNAAPATTPTSGPIKIGSLMLGGAPQSINYNPALTPAGIEQARQVRNQRAYQRLEQQQPGSQGDYDPAFDYEAAERSSIRTGQLRQALISSGYSPADADLLARYNIDAEDRARKKEQLDLERAQIKNQNATTAMAEERQGAGQLEDEATGLLESGVPSGMIGAALKALHPKLTASAITRAVGGAIASKAVRDATIGQKDRSGQPKSKGGLKIMGMDINLDGLGGDSTGVGAGGMDAKDSAMAASDPGFRAWLRTHRATP